jgi:hypothetical protein
MTLARTLILAALAGAAIGAILGLLPAEAGDNAPGAHMWPPARTYAVSIPMGELPSCTVLRDCCGVHRQCGDYYDRIPNPAPVPLPPTLLLLTAAIAALIWKGSNRV